MGATNKGERGEQKDILFQVFRIDMLNVLFV